MSTGLPNSNSHTLKIFRSSYDCFRLQFSHLAGFSSDYLCTFRPIFQSYRIVGEAAEKPLDAFCPETIKSAAECPPPHTDLFVDELCFASYLVVKL